MIIKKDDRPLNTRESMRGGTGVIQLHDLMPADIKPKRLRILSEITVEPGDSIGPHPHEGESEVYFCISGEGKILENGVYVPFKAGDVQVTLDATPHGIKNDGDEDLRFLAVVVLE